MLSGASFSANGQVNRSIQCGLFLLTFFRAIDTIARNSLFASQTPSDKVVHTRGWGGPFYSSRVGRLTGNVTTMMKSNFLLAQFYRLNLLLLA